MTHFRMLVTCACSLVCPIVFGQDGPCESLPELTQLATPSEPNPLYSEFLAGYDDGFFIANPRPCEPLDSAPFLMRINGWSHFRHTYFDSQGPNPHLNQFSIERGRLIFHGHALTPDLSYFLQFNGDTGGGLGVTFLDYFATIDVGHWAFDRDPHRFQVRAGNWKVPFHRSRQFSGRSLGFSDRALASLFFDLNRGQGLGLLGSAEPFGRPLEWEVAVINGFRTDSQSSGRTQDPRQNLAFAGRMSLTPLGDWGPDGVSDLTHHEDPTVRVGGAFAAGRIDLPEAGRGSQFFVVDSGLTLSEVLPPDTNDFAGALFALDVGLRYQGLSCFAEYYFRNIKDIRPVPNLFDHGFVARVGYFLVPGKLEMLARYSRVVGNSGTLGRVDQSADEIAGGVVWYIRGRNLQLNLDATHINGAPLQDNRLDYAPGDVGMFYRGQLQLAF